MPVPERMLLRDVVRNDRLRMGISQTDLGRRVGLSQKAISQLERGEIEQPRSAALLRMAQVFDIKPDVLFGAMLHSTGGATLDELFGAGEVSLELRESIENLTMLPPERQRQIAEMIDAFVMMERARAKS